MNPLEIPLFGDKETLELCGIHGADANIVSNAKTKLDGVKVFDEPEGKAKL